MIIADYDPKPMVRFAESWNLFHLEIDEIYARQIDAQIAEAEVEMMVSSKARGQSGIPSQDVEEEGRLFSLLVLANELVETDKKLMLKAKNMAVLLSHLRQRLGLSQAEERVYFVTMENGAELIDLADLADHSTIQVWARDMVEAGHGNSGNNAEEDLDELLGEIPEVVFQVTQTHIKEIPCGTELRVRWHIELCSEGAIVQLRE